MYQIKGFYGKRGAVGELLTKDKIIWGPGHLFRGRKLVWFVSCRFLLLPVVEGIEVRVRMGSSRGDRQGPKDKLPHWF